MKKKLSKFIGTGIWIIPLLMIGILIYLRYDNPRILKSRETYIVTFIISALPVIIIKLKKANKPKEDDTTTGRRATMYPEVAEELLFDKPTGVLFGRDIRTKKYVCRPPIPDEGLDGHVCAIGGSGSGKSSTAAIPTILSNPDVRFVAVDIKGELSFKSRRLTDKRTMRFAPLERASSYGYNPFYRLEKDKSTQTLYETMQNISYSLIPMPPDIKDPFWKLSSRNLLIGLLIYFYRQGKDNFIDIVDEILSKPIKARVKEIMKNSKESSPEYSYIVQFDEMEDATLGGIVAEMNNHLMVFKNDQDIRYAFRENTEKISPNSVEVDGYSVFICIPEKKLSAYYDVLQLIINQMLEAFEDRPEGSEPIILLLDELPRLLSAGKIERLKDATKTLRSRNVCLFLITQSLEALMSAYTENEVSDLLSNCPYVLVLNASTSKTQKTIIELCGKFQAKKHSFSQDGNAPKVNLNFEDKDLVTSKDLARLAKTGEAILISPFGYSRIKKTPYYKDSYFCKKAENIRKFNETIKEMEDMKNGKKNKN